MIADPSSIAAGAASEPAGAAANERLGARAPGMDEGAASRAIEAAASPEAMALAVLRTPGRSLIEQRLMASLPLPPAIAGALISALAFATSGLPNLLYHEAFAELASRAPVDARDGYFTDEGTWTAFVWSLLLGYVLAAMVMLPRRAILDTLAVVRHIPSELGGGGTNEFVGLRPDTALRSRRAGLLWAAFGFAVLLRSAWVLLAPESVADFVLPFLVRFAWFIVVVPCVCFLLGRAAYISLRTSRLGEQDLLHALRYHVLDPSPFDGLVRMTMRTAAAWIGGATIISLFLFNVPWRYMGATIPLALAAVGVAAALVWTPIVSINRRMRALKFDELGHVLGEIERDRRALADAAEAGVADAGIAARMSALLAYRQAVQQAPEWPIGVSNGWRIVVLMVLPVLGWIAAALVERLLSSML